MAWNAPRWLPVFGLALLALFVVPSAGSAQVFTPDQLSEMPQIDAPRAALQAIQQSYPSRLRDRGIEGRVQVSFVVTADGSVDPASVEVVQTENQELGAAAITAVRQIKFKPGKKDGSAVASRVVIPIAYTVS